MTGNSSDKQSPDSTIHTAAGRADDVNSRLLAPLVALVRGSARIVALTGAGISTESGIPDYRGPGGVWERRAPPTLDDFRTNAETRRRYWEGRRINYPKLAAAKPNTGHDALAALGAAGRLTGVITQNIDGLHQAAGMPDDRVLELHGSAHRVRCLDCGATWPAAEIQDRLAGGESEPACERCGGPLRAATILFGEPLPPLALQQAIALTNSCDLMLVIGSSLIVNPASQLPVLAKRAGARLAIINRTPTPLDPLADVRIIGEAGPVLSLLAQTVVSGQ